MYVMYSFVCVGTYVHMYIMSECYCKCVYVLYIVMCIQGIRLIKIRMLGRICIEEIHGISKLV